MTARAGRARRLGVVACLAALTAFLSCHPGQPSPSSSPAPAPVPVPAPQSALPESIRFDLHGETDPDGFCAARGSTNLPPGARVLVTIAAAADRGADLSESTLAPVGADGSFEARSLLAYPAAYALRAEFSRAANPKRPEWFGAAWDGLPVPKEARVERDPDGSPRLVARAAWRIGTEAQAAELVDAHLDALAAVAKRLKYDREQAEKKIKPPAAAGSAAYLKWARIRAEKAHALKIDQPGADPLFGPLDLELRRLWKALDEAGLYYLAQALGDDQEAARSEAALKRFDRLFPDAESELSRLRGPAK